MDPAAIAKAQAKKQLDKHIRLLPIFEIKDLLYYVDQSQNDVRANQKPKKQASSSISRKKDQKLMIYSIVAATTYERLGQ